MQSDKKLMQLVRKGNHSAFAQLVNRHTDRFLALAIRTLNNHGDAEDVVQNALVKLWQNPHSWDASKSQFTTWFYRVIINACHDLQRKHQRSVLLESHTLEALMPVADSEAVIYASKQQVQAEQVMLRSAMSELPSSQRDAINLVVYCALPQKQAAEVMGVSLKALESLLGRARRSLAEKIAAMQAASAAGADTAAHVL